VANKNIYNQMQFSGDECYTTRSEADKLLELGLDFYYYEPKEWDLIITNPPFSNRTNLFKRLLDFNKPFIILQPTQFFNNQTAVSMLCNGSDNFKFIMPQSRMSFMTYNKIINKVIKGNNGIAFYSFWISYKLNLPKIFNLLPNNGREKELEEYDVFGNVIEDNHLSLFNYFNKLGEG
jgi:hypothetical protein